MTTDAKGVGMVLVIPRERANSERAEKLRLIEHALQDAAQFLLIKGR